MAPEKKIPLIFTKECGYVPAVLVNAGEIIEKHITTENLFQVQGSTAKLKKLMSILSLQKIPKLRKFNVHDVVEVIKVCLFRLSKELIPDHVMSLLIEANQSQMTDYTTILALYRRTAPLTFSAVHYTMRLLNKVIQHSESNGMDARKLATIFVLDVLKPLTGPRKDNQQECDYEIVRHNCLEKLPYLIMVMEQLILKVSAFKKASVYRSEVKPRNSPNVENVDKREGESGIGDTVSKGTPDEAEGATSLNGHSPKRERLAREEEQAKEYNEPINDDSNNFLSRPVSQRGRLTPKWKTSTSGKQPTGATKSCSTQMNKRLTSSRRSTSDMGTSHSRTTTAHVISRRGASLTAPWSRGKKAAPRIKSNLTVAGWKGAESHYGLIKDKATANTSLNKAVPCKVIRGGGSRKARRCKDSRLKKQAAVPFHQDEELLPWSNVQLDSDDTSVMQRSIRYPRVGKGRNFPTSESSRATLENEEDSRNGHALKVNKLLPEDVAPELGKSKQPTDQVVCQPPSSAGFGNRSSCPNNVEPKQTLYRRESLPSNEKSSFVSLSGPIRRERCHSRCNGSRFPVSRRSDSKSEPARRSPAIKTFKSTLPNHRPTPAERHVKVHMLNSLRAPKKPSRYLQRATDIVLLGLALFCTYFLFLLLQWHQGD